MQRRQKHRIGKWVTLFISTLSAATLWAAAAGSNPLFKAPTPTPAPAPAPAPANSGVSNQILTQIKLNTDLILKKVDQIPALLTELLNITKVEEKAVIANTQANMDTLGQYFQYGLTRDPNTSDNNNDNIDAFNNELLTQQRDTFADSQSIGKTQFDSNSFKPSRNGLVPINSAIPNINTLSYTNAIGFMPLISTDKKDPTWRNSYVKTASGASLYHAKPTIGNPITLDQKNYLNYFNLAYAVQSFNNYVLSKYLLRGTEVSQQQSMLYRKASNGAYLSTIATNPIGNVLRDSLLFQSQQYVLTAKLVELQRETLMATVMTNALLIAVNQQTESALYTKTSLIG